MNRLFLFALGQIFEKKVGALLHFLAADIEDLRTNATRAVFANCHKHQLGVSIAGVIVVPADRGNVKTLLYQVTEPGQHFHAVSVNFIREKSTLNTPKRASE